MFNIKKWIIIVYFNHYILIIYFNNDLIILFNYSFILFQIIFLYLNFLFGLSFYCHMFYLHMFFLALHLLYLLHPQENPILIDYHIPLVVFYEQNIYLNFVFFFFSWSKKFRINTFIDFFIF